MEFAQEMERLRRMAEERLAEFFPGNGLEEAMRYSLLAGGKRIRPILAMEFCRAAGGAPEEAPASGGPAFDGKSGGKTSRAGDFDFTG